MQKLPTVRRLASFALLACAFAATAPAQGIFAVPAAPSDLPAAMQTANTPVFAAEREALAARQRSVIGGTSTGAGGPSVADRSAGAAGGGGTSKTDDEETLDGKPSLRFRPRLTYRYQYGDGIPASPGQVHQTALHEITPGILVEAGDHWTLDYAPTWSLYSNRAFDDTLDHHAVLTGGGTHVDWTWGFSQSFAIDHDVLLETAAQTFRKTWDTDLRLALQFNSELMIDSSFQQNLRNAETYADTREWSNFTWLHFNLNPRLNAGLGLGGGFLEMEGPDVYFLQAQGRVAWKPTDRLSLSVTAGADRRFSSDDRVPLRTSPIYGATFSYHPFPHTDVSLHGNRAVEPSYYASELIDRIDWGASISQRFFSRFSGTLGYSRGTADYVASSANADPNRHDDFTSIDARLATRIRERGTVAVFYHDANNDSSSGGFSTTSKQVGFELGIRY